MGGVPGGFYRNELINRRFDGTITPLAIGFVVSGAIAFAAWRRAERVVVTG